MQCTESQLLNGPLLTTYLINAYLGVLLLLPVLYSLLKTRPPFEPAAATAAASGVKEALLTVLAETPAGWCP